MRRASIVALLITLTLASITHAQQSDDASTPEVTRSHSLAGSWRIHGETILLLTRPSSGLVHQLWRANGTAAPRPSGLSAPMLGIGVGYAVLDYLVGGLRIAGGYDSVTLKSGTVNETAYSGLTLDVAPYVELMTRGDGWRLFGAVALHHRIESYTRTPSPREIGQTAPDQRLGTEKVSVWGGSLTAGARLFLSEAVSVDASALLFMFSDLSIQLGLSGWL